MSNLLANVLMFTLIPVAAATIGGVLAACFILSQREVDTERQRADVAQKQVDELLAQLRSIFQGRGYANEEDR